MNKLDWRFPLLDGGDEQGINNSGIATFKGAELYDNLAREICQNSLDAKADGEETVIVEFKSMSIKKEEHSALVGLDSIIQACDDYWAKRAEPKLKSFINEAKNKLAQDHIDFLVISDYNTNGLSGAKAAVAEKSVWRALTHSNGVTEKEQGSGGSYGIGKNAPFACSSFRTIFYNSYAKLDGVKAFQGVSRLATHFDVNGNQTQGVGFFQNVVAQKPVFECDNCNLRDIFSRKEYGTDVIIAGFKKTDTWAEDIEKAVLFNFFVAIIYKKLIVRIDGLEINDKTIATRIKYYSKLEKDNDAKDKKISKVQEFYEAVTSNENIIKKGTIIEKDDVILYLKKDDKFSKAIAEMRSIGMVVRIRHKTEFTRYAAVMIVVGEALNDLLKTIEPPQHNEWDPDRIEDDEMQNKYAKRIKTKLIKWTNDSIIDCCRCEVPDEIDLDGVSAYLPYENDDAGLGQNEKEEDKSPDSQNDMCKATCNKMNVRTVVLAAQKVEGERDENIEPQNTTGGGKIHGQGGVPNKDGKDEVKAPLPGDKAVNAPKVLSQRIIQMPEASTYRVSLVLENDCDVVHIALKAIGDDGGKESLMIKNYKFEKNKVAINSEYVVLHDLKARVQYEIFLYLEYSEKMLLELLIY